DLYVTGVQTCALPISRSSGDGQAIEGAGQQLREREGPAPGMEPAPSVSLLAVSALGGADAELAGLVAGPHDRTVGVQAIAGVRRSEERRVGKECRCWW